MLHAEDHVYSSRQLWLLLFQYLQGCCCLAVCRSEKDQRDSTALRLFVRYSGSQKYVPTFEPTLHQDFQL